MEGGPRILPVTQRVNQQVPVPWLFSPRGWGGLRNISFGLIQYFWGGTQTLSWEEF